MDGRMCFIVLLTVSRALEFAVDESDSVIVGISDFWRTYARRRGIDMTYL
jgi:hypothetical protein